MNSSTTKIEPVATMPATNPIVGVGEPPSRREWLLTLGGACLASVIVAAGVSEALPDTFSPRVHAILSVLISTVVVSLCFYQFRVNRMVERTKEHGATPLAQRRAMLSDMSRRVIGSMIEQSDLNVSIEMLLRECGEALPVSRAYLIRYRDRRQHTEVTHHWSGPSALEPRNFVDGLDTINSGWWNQHLMADEPLALADLDKAKMPAKIYAALREQGVRSILAAPIFIFGELEGFFAFDVTNSDAREWTREEITVIDNMTDAFARAVERRISERQQTAAADRMEKALASAEAESRAKTDFLANMSHEIRTPMAAVVGYADMLQRPEQSANQVAECVEHIRRNADHLLSLVNDILDLSKIEAGELSLRIEACKLLVILDQVKSMTEPQAREKMLKFNIEFVGRVPETIHTDPVRFRQVLLNLVGNAIKFTDTGSVTLRVELRDQPPESVREFLKIADDHSQHSWLKIDVIDTGIGIPSAQISRLFSPFTQVHDQSERRYGGTGLGLDISRRLAHMLNADVTVASIEGQGSTFTFHVDVGVVTDVDLVEPSEKQERFEQPITTVPESDVLPGLRVLVVDDNVDNRRIARFFLEDAKSLVTEVGNGREAIEQVIRFRDTDNAYQLILMDMQMPVMDGYTATTKLREMGVGIPIIALTAYTMADDRHKCLSAGCNDYVSKPIVAEVLYERILEQITGQPRVEDGKTLRLENRTPPRDEPDTPPTSDDSPDAPAESNQHETPAPNNAAEEAASLAEEATEIDMDIKPIRSQMADNQDFHPLLEAYMERLPILIDNIEKHWKAGEANEVATIVHQLKGTGANYGYPMITEAAKSCEQAIRAELPMSQIQPLLQTVLRFMRGAVLGFEKDVAKTE